MKQHTWTAPSHMTVEEWANSWAETHLRRNVSTRSYERQASIVRLYIVPALGKIALQKLSTKRVNEFSRGLETGERKLSPAPVRYAHIVLGSCLKQAVKEGHLVRSPVANATAPKAGTQSGGRALTQPELDRLLRSFEGNELFPLVVLAAGTGARINEMLALGWVGG